MKTIRIECVGAGVLPIDEMHDFQGELKSLSKDNYRKLKSEIVDTGFAFPIHIWTDPETKKHYIVGGHQRVKTLTQMRDKEMYVVPEIPVVYVWASDFFEAKRRVLQDISQYGHIERQGLYEFMIHADLDMDEMSSAFDFSEPPIDMEKFEVEFFDDPKPEPKAGDDEIPEIKTERVHRGQIWELGKHRLMCGDSTSIEDVAQLMNGQTADICFTSPPYNAGSLNIKGQSGTQKKYNSFDDNQSENEYLDFLNANMGCILAHSHECFYNIGLVEGSKRAIVDIMARWKTQFKDIIYWKKDTVAPHIQPGIINNKVEFILCFGNGKRKFENAQFSQGTYWNVIEGPNARGNEYSDIHKATFPVYLAENIVLNFSPSGGSVLDTFGGTGTTMIACEKNDRHCYMMELDAWYCTVIIERWIKFTGNDAQRINEDGTKTPYSSISK